MNKIYYHGSNYKFDKFDKEKIKENKLGLMFNFTDDYAKAYEYGNNIIKARLDLNNPLTIEDFEHVLTYEEDCLLCEIMGFPKISKERFEQEKSRHNETIGSLFDPFKMKPKFIEFLKRLGYDGIAIPEEHHYGVFEPEQIHIIQDESLIDNQDDLNKWFDKNPAAKEKLRLLQDLKKEIRRLEEVVKGYGEENTRLSHKFYKENGYYTDPEKWNREDFERFKNNLAKRKECNDRIIYLNHLISQVNSYKPQELTQLKLFNIKDDKMNEELKKYVIRPKKEIEQQEEEIQEEASFAQLGTAPTTANGMVTVNGVPTEGKSIKKKKKKKEIEEEVNLMDDSDREMLLGDAFYVDSEDEIIEGLDSLLLDDSVSFFVTDGYDKGEVTIYLNDENTYSIIYDYDPEQEPIEEDNLTRESVLDMISNILTTQKVISRDEYFKKDE